MSETLSPQVFMQKKIAEQQADHERIFTTADRYCEYIKKLVTVQPVSAIPNEIGQILYDDLEMIQRYDGVIFLTKLGIMYLRSRKLI